MANEQVFYKVVKRRSKNCRDLTSCVLGAVGYGLKYKTQRWRKPALKNSKIFVFDTLDNAKNFLNKNWYTDKEKICIYECEVRNPEKAKKYAFYPMDHDIEHFWKNVFYDVHIDEPPTGTYFADAIKLTRRIDAQ